MSMTESKPTKQKPRHRKLWVTAPLAVLLMICFIAAGLVFGYHQIRNTVVREFGQPVSSLTLSQRVRYTLMLYFSKDDLLVSGKDDGLPVLFNIQLNESLLSIADRLEFVGAIPDAEIFVTYLTYSGLDTSIQAGSYEFSASETPREIAMQMQDATPGKIPFYMLAGWRVEEAAQALVEYGLLDETVAFLALAAEPEGLPLPEGWPENLGVEGLLFPGEYLIPREASPRDILSLFLLRFSDEVIPSLKARYEDRQLSLDQAVTLASIVEKEAVRVEEQPLIASVFFNRLENGMKLETDPTVQYAVGYIEHAQTWWKNPLTAVDLEIISPFNTYKINGLPLGPICSPGLSALKAVATSPESQFFFFRARCDGSGYHNFSRTFEEHLNQACK